MKKLLSLGLVRGLLWEVVGTALGIGLVTLIRWLMKLQAWNAEPAIVFGALLGALFFLYGVGSLDGWLAWARGEATPEHFDDTHLGWARYYSASLDHKVIDRVGYLDSTLDGLKKSLNLDKASVIMYYRPGTYKGTIYSEAGGNTTVVNILPQDLESLLPRGMQFMYLWAP